ncbi:DgyrCDS3203 [Dimorphilus gyrociliatus]|uniref:DgyrCDS3203 n=1 Tax=Dimorphilus gyrociliatus TaxID=2664684 RepID=A0A7I8VCW5_9ANNE|nr:DgyrCDS3203 [Dimorphilus gyrociliatus]
MATSFNYQIELQSLKRYLDDNNFEYESCCYIGNFPDPKRFISGEFIKFVEVVFPANTILIVEDEHLFSLITELIMSEKLDFTVTLIEKRDFVQFMKNCQKFFLMNCIKQKQNLFTYVFLVENIDENLEQLKIWYFNKALLKSKYNNQRNSTIFYFGKEIDVINMLNTLENDIINCASEFTNRLCEDEVIASLERQNLQKRRNIKDFAVDHLKDCLLNHVISSDFHNTTLEKELKLDFTNTVFLNHFTKELLNTKRRYFSKCKASFLECLMDPNQKLSDTIRQKYVDYFNSFFMQKLNFVKHATVNKKSIFFLDDESIKDELDSIFSEEILSLCSNMENNLRQSNISSLKKFVTDVSSQNLVKNELNDEDEPALSTNVAVGNDFAEDKTKGQLLSFTFLTVVQENDFLIYLKEKYLTIVRDLLCKVNQQIKEEQIQEFSQRMTKILQDYQLDKFTIDSCIKQLQDIMKNEEKFENINDYNKKVKESFTNELLIIPEIESFMDTIKREDPIKHNLETELVRTEKDLIEHLGLEEVDAKDFLGNISKSVRSRPSSTISFVGKASTYKQFSFNVTLLNQILNISNEDNDDSKVIYRKVSAIFKEQIKYLKNKLQDLEISNSGQILLSKFFLIFLLRNEIYFFKEDDLNRLSYSTSCITRIRYGDNSNDEYSSLPNNDNKFKKVIQKDLDFHGENYLEQLNSKLPEWFSILFEVDSDKSLFSNLKNIDYYLYKIDDVKLIILKIMDHTLGHDTGIFYQPFEDPVWDLIIFGTLTCNTDLINCLIGEVNPISACLIISIVYKNLAHYCGSIKSDMNLAYEEKFTALHEEYSKLANTIFSELYDREHFEAYITISSTPVFSRKTMYKDFDDESKTETDTVINLAAEHNLSHILVERRLVPFLNSSWQGSEGRYLISKIILRAFFTLIIMAHIGYYVIIQITFELNKDLFEFSSFLCMILYALGFIVDEIQDVYAIILKSLDYHLKFKKNIRKLQKVKYNIFNKVAKDVWKSYFKNGWNVIDYSCIIAFLISILLKLLIETNYSIATRLSFGITAILLSLKFLQFLTIFKSFGYLIVAMILMVKDILLFVTIFPMFVFSFGIAYFGFMKVVYDERPFNEVMGELSFLEFWVVVGEMNTDKVNEDVAAVKKVAPFSSLGNVLHGVYAIVTNILLLNILIAKFASSYIKAEEKAVNLWAAEIVQRIYEYKQKFFLPPPLNIFGLLFLAIRNAIFCRGSQVAPSKYVNGITKDICREVVQEVVLKKNNELNNREKKSILTEAYIFESTIRWKSENSQLVKILKEISQL